MRVGEISPEIVADFRARLEAAGVGRHSVRQSMVVLQAMFEQAIRWGWVATNPVKAVRKPSARRQRAVVCLAPGQVEAIRSVLIEEGRLYAATMVSLVAYQGLRVPEELLALELKYQRRNTILIEQRNIDGRIVGGQKVRGFHPRAIDLLEPVRRDLRDYLLATGIREGILFPRRDGSAWRLHDYQNWRRRVWHTARQRAEVEPLPPYDLRHAFASLQIRAGLPIPELAEQMGHSPQMTLMAYTHVIRELKGEPAVSAAEQIERARRVLEEGRVGAVITVEAGHFRSHGDGEPPEGSLTEMFGATFSGPHGELFTVLIDPRPDHFVIQVDESEEGPSFEVAEARAGHVLLSISRDDDRPLAEVRQFSPWTRGGRLELGGRQCRVARTRLTPGIAPPGFEPGTSRL